MNPRDIRTLEQVKMQQADLEVDVETLAHHLIDGVYTKVFCAKKAGTFIGQHAHVYDHGTLVAAGEFRVFLDGIAIGDFKTGDMITIAAGKKHVLLALEDNSVGACIHNAHGEAEPAIAEESRFLG